MSTRSQVRYTYEDYRSVPEDTSRRHEIVYGELFVTAAPRFRHQRIVTALARLLGGLVVEHDLGELVVGPVGVHLHDEGVTEPDLVFIRKDRLEIVDLEGDVHGPPDLVIEVLSPSNRADDRGAKLKQYLESGVAEVWLVDAEERTIERWRPHAAEPERIRDAMIWSVAGQRFPVALEEVFGA